MRYRQAFALTLTLALLMGLAGPGQAQKALKIFMIPKFTGAAYFAATEKGAKDAVAELKGRGVAIDFLYTGPSVANTDEEIRMIDDLVAQKPDAIIISANDAEALVPVAKKAKAAGIKVITYDADVADPTARHWFVNQGTFTLVGAALVDVVAEQAGSGARFAVVSADPGAFNQNSWIAAMKDRVAKKYPAMKLVDIRYGLDKPAESFSVAQDLINKYRGQLDAIIAPTSVALPKVAEAAEQAGLAGKIVVTGLSTPNDMREFVKKGTVKTVVLWNPVDLGYLAVYVAHATITGTLKEGMAKQSVQAGRLGTRAHRGRFLFWRSRATSWRGLQRRPAAYPPCPHRPAADAGRLCGAPRGAVCDAGTRLGPGGRTVQPHGCHAAEFDVDDLPALCRAVRRRRWEQTATRSGPWPAMASTCRPRRRP